MEFRERLFRFDAGDGGELLTTAWGYEYVGASRTVDVHINRLRTKLGLDKEIQTVFKVGYRLNTHPGC